MKVTQQKALVLLEQGAGLQQRLTQRSFGDQAEDNAIIIWEYYPWVTGPGPQTGVQGSDLQS